MEIGKKKCTKCRKSKPPREFYKRSDVKDRTMSECKECNRKRRLRHYHKNPEPQRCRTLRRRYGIDSVEYQRLLSKQNHRCDICGVHEDDVTKRLNVDHCHESTNVRGLLCHHCNMALGYARDDPEILWNAIDYLDKHQHKEE